MLFLLPGEDRRDGIVPDRSDDDASKAGDPPNLVPGKDVAGDVMAATAATACPGLKAAPGTVSVNQRTDM